LLPLLPFEKQYPISIFVVLVSAISFQGNHDATHHLDPPMTNAMRDLAEYAGFTYGHLRTIPLLWNREGLLVTQGERRGLHWLFCPKLKTVHSNLEPGTTEENISTRAVCIFTLDESKLRQTAHEILKHFRF
jgi:hypothetical protein